MSEDVKCAHYRFSVAHGKAICDRCGSNIFDAFTQLRARALAAEALLRECVVWIKYVDDEDCLAIHKPGCDISPSRLDGEDKHCSCGLDDLLARAREQLK